MPRVQLGRRVDPTSTGSSARWSVEVRKKWRDRFVDPADADNTWTKEPYLRPLIAREATLAGRSFARFEWTYGPIERTDSTSPGTPGKVLPILDKSSDWFVRIILHPNRGIQPVIGPRPPAPPVEEPIAIWTGIIPKQSFDVFGDIPPSGSEPGFERGVQTIEAYGLDWLLRNSKLYGSYVHDDGSVEFFQRVIAFNRRERRGRANLGNRSTGRQGYTPESPGGTANYIGATSYVFEGRDPLGNFFRWTNTDAAEYVLASRTGRPRFFIAGQLDSLDQFSDQIETKGKSLHGILTTIIDRRRGQLSFVDTQETIPAQGAPPGDGNPELKIFSSISQPIAVGNVIVPANPNQVDVSLPTSRHNPEQFVIEINHEARPEWIIVRGGASKSMFSIDAANGLLGRWTEDEENAYLDGDPNGTTAEEHDRFRGNFPNVFRRFIIDSEFDWFSDGLAIIPTFDANAVVKNLSIGGDTGKVWPGFNALLRSLLIEETDSDEPEFVKPFVVGYNSQSDTHFFIHRPPASPGGGIEDGTFAGHIRMGDRQLTWEVVANPNHLFALDDWIGAADTNTEPISYWGDQIATLAVRGDSIPQVIRRVTGGAAFPIGHDSVQVIEVPSVEVWTITRNTVIGINGDGTLILANESTVPINPAFWGVNFGLLRDDTEELRTIAALTESWYGQEERAALTLKLPVLTNDYPLGTLIRDVVGVKRTAINTPVTEREYDFESHTLTIKTEVITPDFRRLIPRKTV